MKEIIASVKKDNWVRNFVKSTMEDINKLVDEIHEKFGYGCLVLKYENLTQEQRCALWSFCNIYLNTALKEGLCLQPLEFVCVKKMQDKFEKSVCAISEFAGCSRSLGGAV